MFIYVRLKGVTSMSTEPRGRLILSIPNSLNLLVCGFSIFRTGRGKDKCLKVNATSPLAQPGGQYTSFPATTRNTSPKPESVVF